MTRVNGPERNDLTKKDIPGIVIALVVTALMIWGDAWPEHRNAAYTTIKVIVGLVIAAFAVYACITLYDPSEADRVRTCRKGITVLHNSGTKVFFSWEAITFVSFVRDESPWEGFIETTWAVRCGAGDGFFLDGSWLKNWRLYWAFWIHLPQFDAEAARSGLHSWRKGRWICLDEEKGE
jgi:hypothetical protein